MNLFANPRLADEKPVHWPGESNPIHVGKVVGSTFTMTPEEASPGLQVIDVILWLFKRSLSNKPMGPNCARLLNRALQKGSYHDFSFEGVGKHGDEKLDDLMARDLSEDQEAKGREMMAEIEARRQKAMQEYAAEKAMKAG